MARSGVMCGQSWQIMMTILALTIDLTLTLSICHFQILCKPLDGTLNQVESEEILDNAEDGIIIFPRYWWEKSTRFRIVFPAKWCRISSTSVRCKGWCTNCGRSHRAHGWQVCYPSHGRAFDSMLVSSICSNQNHKDRIDFWITNHESQLKGAFWEETVSCKMELFLVLVSWCNEAFRLKMPDQSTAFCGTVFYFDPLKH